MPQSKPHIHQIEPMNIDSVFQPAQSNSRKRPEGTKSSRRYRPRNTKLAMKVEGSSGKYVLENPRKQLLSTQNTAHTHSLSPNLTPTEYLKQLISISISKRKDQCLFSKLCNCTNSLYLPLNSINSLCVPLSATTPLSIT